MTIANADFAPNKLQLVCYANNIVRKKVQTDIDASALVVNDPTLGKVAFEPQKTVDIDGHDAKSAVVPFVFLKDTTKSRRPCSSCIRRSSLTRRRFLYQRW